MFIIGRDDLTKVHHIVLVHGIRTHAQWYEAARQVFTENLGYKLHPIKYGRFDLFRFMLPGPWRRGPIEKSRSKIAPILLEAKLRGEVTTIVSHSNGTHVVSKLMQQEATFEIENLIMCGSVVDDDFDWNAVKHKIHGFIVNDYGVNDIWPAVARSLSWGYGYSGTNGFGSPVEDRLHSFGHSDYFEVKFMEEYWKSITGEKTIKRPPLCPDGELPKSPGWFAIFEFPWRWVLLFAIVAGIASLGVKFSSVMNEAALMAAATDMIDQSNGRLSQEEIKALKYDRDYILVPVRNYLIQNKSRSDLLKSTLYSELDWGIQESYYERVRRDGPDEHELMHGIINDLVRDNKYIMDKLNFYMGRARTEVFKKQENLFRIHASRYASRWERMRQAAISGQKRPIAEPPFPKKFTRSLDAEIAEVNRLISKPNG